ncbi:hypothetical protein VTK56DRAFT_3540 [Thermocarpiscus australiensis]
MPVYWLPLMDCGSLQMTVSHEVPSLPGHGRHGEAKPPELFKSCCCSWFLGRKQVCEAQYSHNAAALM